MQQRMNSNMGSRVKIRFELVPKLRWLIPKIPFKVFISRREVTFFRPRSLLVPSNSHAHRLLATSPNHRLEPISLEQSAALDTGQCTLGKCPPSLKRFPILADHEIDPPFPNQPISESYHLGNLETGIDVDAGDWQMTKERVAHQPQKYGRVFSNTPKHRKPPEFSTSPTHELYPRPLPDVKTCKPAGPQ